MNKRSQHLLTCLQPAKCRKNLRGGRIDATIEKPYACDQCDARFAVSGHLVTHKRTHSGEKPYACDQCDARFTEKGYLHLHREHHHSVAPYGQGKYDGTRLCKTCRRMIAGTKCRAYGMCAQCIGAYQRTEHFVQQYLWLTGLFPSSCDDRMLCEEDSTTLHKKRCNSRPDLSYVLFDRVVVVEVDERSHESNSLENELHKLDKTRWGVANLPEHESKPVVVVRFNPDQQPGAQRAALLDERLPTLVERIKHWIECPLSELDPLRCNVEYLFYGASGEQHITAAQYADNVHVLRC